MKLSWKSGIFVLFAAAALCFLQPNTACARDVSGGNWIWDQGMYWYRCADSTYPANEICTIDGICYGFDVSGWMVTGWYNQNGDWYYFDNSGAMHYGWLWADGAWYYLEDMQSENPGRMLADCSKKIGDNTYYFWQNGVMRTGWIYNRDKWYYIDANGYLAAGWILDGSTWYYMQPGSGAMAVNTWIGNDYVGADGVWIPLNAGEQVYYVDKGNGNTAMVIGRFDTAMSSEIFRLLNEYRISEGLPALKSANKALQDAVNIRAYETADSFLHERPNGEMCFTVYENACAENIACGYGSAEAVMEAWKNSPGHNMNMLSSYAASVGIAVFVDRNEIPYFVQLFSWD